MHLNQAPHSNRMTRWLSEVLCILASTAFDGEEVVDRRRPANACLPLSKSAGRQTDREAERQAGSQASSLSESGKIVSL